MDLNHLQLKSSHHLNPTQAWTLQSLTFVMGPMHAESNESRRVEMMVHIRENEPLGNRGWTR